ncbi:MAG TPA: DMT family transporter [Candidatus Limnocylindrales bacterium]|nr:DMT family transporter [Candidatus Limnocylindrales bacterium]
MLQLATDRLTLAAFAAMVLFGGGNGVSVHFSNLELAPFWGATIRFGLATVVFFAIVALRRIPVPRGPALTGSVLYGLLGFGGAFGFVYWGLVETPPGLAQIILAVVPLLTFLLAVGLGMERFRWQGLAGALLAIAGIAVIFGDGVGAAVPVVSMLAIVGAAACMAVSNVVVKRYPKCHPVVNNAIAMGVGAGFLLLLSLTAGEAHVLPTQARTLAAISYLVIVGSVGVFSLFLYVITRWSASATSYVMLLMPLVAVVVAAALAGEAVTPAYVSGGALVLGGVYVGAFAPSLGALVARVTGRAPAPAEASGASAAPVLEMRPAGPSTPLTPGCA